MSNKIVKVLFLLAFSASSAVAKASPHHEGHHKHAHHHQRVKHRHYQARLPQDDLTCLANTAYREARNSESNLQAVANVAKNRLQGGWGRSYCHVIRTGRFVYAVRHPDQESYAKAHEIARKVMDGELPDNTGGAVFFHAAHLRHRPKWAKPQYLSARIGGNVFYLDSSTALRVAYNNPESELDSRD
jgi:spore germination cell wall hydrolase CwlJ-like protein